MMDELITQLQPAVVSICVTVLTALGSWIGIKVKQLYTEKVNTETKKNVVETTCRYVNQLYYDLDGPSKLEKAKTEILNQLNEKGIKITDLELNVLIEAAVNGFKDSVNSNTITTVETPVIEATETEETV